MKKIILILFPFFSLACSNEITESIPAVNEEYQILDFQYNGIAHSVKYRFNSDSTVVFEDVEMEKLINEMDNEPELVTHINADESVSYYANQEIFRSIKELKADSTVDISTRSYSNACKIVLYENANYTGATRSITNVWRAPSLTIYNNLTGSYLNDKASSVKMESYVGNITVVFYQNENHKGKSLSFDVITQWGSSPIKNIPNLKNYTYRTGFLGLKKKNWDNRISSVNVMYGVKNSF
ncbi:hypothetical protein [Bacteroides sp. 519]|uniref:hypothetical protein n=1 Tax=Bacteroides sp. 519 TaxID=2302937 RepID=UPI0013D67B36|nr:hypothetical protein [Bacteroides sp. 519]NDV57320.1 hypothetical protein [Bacteroides sp. 519]